MRELASHLGVDWRLLVAQAANFLILFFIFRKFVLRPLMRILSVRRQEIAKGLAFTQRAEERLASAQRERNTLVKEARVEAVAIVSQAKEIGKIKKDEMMAEARKKAEEIALETKRRFQQDRLKLEGEVARGAEALVRFGIGRVLGRMDPRERDRALIGEALEEWRRMQKHEI